MDKIRQTKDYYKTIATQTFWGLFPALLVANLIPELSAIINGLLVGNAFEPASMAAVSFAWPVNKVISSIAVLFSNGAGIVYGHYLGRGQSDNLHKVYTSTVLSLMVIGLALTALGEIITAPIAQLIGSGGESFSDTVAYLRGLFIGLVPMILMPSFVTFLNFGNEATYGMLSSLVLAVGNLIFGLLNVHVFHMGMFGMGLASSLAQFCATVFLIVKFVKRPELGHMVEDINILQEVVPMVKLGSPSAAVGICGSIRNMLINTFTFDAGRTLAVAGYGILCSSSSFFCVIIPSLVSATATMASINIGEEDRASVFSLTRYLLKASAMIFIGVAIVYYASAPLLAELYGAADMGLDYATNCIRMYTAELSTVWFIYVIDGVHQSFGRARLTIVMNLLTIFVYPVLVMLIAMAVLPDSIKLYGIWSCYGLAALLGIVTLLIISWVKSGHFPSRVEYLLWLEHDYGVKSDNRMTIVVKNIDEVVSVSENVQNFCISRGIDKSRSMQVAVCLEEMAGNVIIEGFKKCKNKKNLVVDIYVAIKSDEVFIRLKDNAAQYDAFRKLDMYKEQEDDPAKNFGIRMISKIAKDMKYQTTLGINVLTIKI